MYSVLLQAYGPQGWWPLLCHKGANPTKTGSVKGYHPGDYTLPATGAQRFEICVGAILTQNTSWVQVEKALFSLHQKKALSPAAILQLDDETLKAAIKPAGYFNQKARKIKEFARFYQQLHGTVPSREALLSVWGIGDETADSMLLYAFRVPTFVVDAYTLRIFSALGLLPATASYQDAKSFVEKNLPPDLAVYQEFHALLVEHAKRHYTKRPYGVECPLNALLELEH